MNAARHFTVVIIGAGPSGLALGCELRLRGLDFVILDKGAVGDSWSRMPARLKLVSPWKTNWLTRGTARRFAPHAQLARSGFLDYLRELAEDNELPVVTGCEVASVERAGEEFLVRTSPGDFSARMVVNATGYFSNPVLPRLAGEETTRIPRGHYADFDAQKIVTSVGRGGQVLIVGHRLSAGQTALELFDVGMRVAISHRSPIRFGVDDWLWPVVYRTFAWAEAVRLKFSGGGAGKLDVFMPGGRVRKLIRSGAIQTFPALAHFEGDAIVFENGATISPGLVLYATGFAPSLRHLRTLGLEINPDTGVPLTCDMESVSVPNLFFLGFEMLRNFQSRFLRGIRHDAIALAAEIERRVVGMADTRPSDSQPVNLVAADVRRRIPFSGG